MNCCICTEPFTKRRQNVKCQYCDFSACTDCYKTYLLGRSKPTCMSNECTGEWSRKHLRDNFTQTFISKDLREHQKNILIETQMALMPETQLVIEDIKRVARLNKKINALSQQLNDKREANAKFEGEKMGEYNRKKKAIRDMGSWHTGYYGNLFIDQLKKAIEMFSNPDNSIPDHGLTANMNEIIEKYNMIENQVKANVIEIETYNIINSPEWVDYIMRRDTEMNEITNEIERLRRIRNNGAKKHRTEFVKKCGDPECRGFLSTRWKCGLCEKSTCIDCHEVKVDGVDHVCDQNCVATIKLLTTDTKNCPGCQSGITKIDGCDQMWCTHCQTGFSWSTGKIEMKLHNPHYYEWRRQNGGLDREPGDNQQCVTPQDIITLLIASDLGRDQLDILIEKCRRCIHISAYNNNPQVPNYQSDRIKYLNQTIDAEEFKSTLIRVSKAYSKKQELYTVYELLVTTFTDIMRRFCDDLESETILNELNTIVDYVYVCFADIAYSYGCISKHVIGYDMGVSKVSMKKPTTTI